MPAALASPVAPFADASLARVPTPGHTPDHHSVWAAARGTLFAGALYLGVRVRIAHPRERPRETLASVRRMAALAPARLFCAHRGAVPTPTAALLAKAEWMAETIGRVEGRIAEGWSDRAIRDDVLGGESATGYVTSGEYARVNFVRAVRAEGAGGRAPAGVAAAI
jgi:glyoxylase-like metal-dependent hydrolase (beta-lactamase superfamily II)